jgi:hypothetical protein
MQVKWNGEWSEKIHLKQGTMKGAKLFTVLYKVYQNILLDLVTDSGLGARIGSIPVSVSKCADDTAILSNNSYELQAVLNLVDFCTKRALVKINPDK